jgi:methionyl-tRNA synthetase
MAPFYVTTPIYYVNGAPHLGNLYTTTIADILARYHRLFGDETLFLTGVDEHGQKAEEAALQRGLTPQVHCDDMAASFEKAWRHLGISHDIFMRTTFPHHQRVVQDCLAYLHEKGDIYSAEYEGWYSVSEEMFFTEKEIVNGLSPAGKPVQRVTEKNYFFRMSKYQDALIAYLEGNPDYIQPEGKRSEVLGFLRQPLADLCISRPKKRLAWGIPVPFDEEFVTYVWFDALLNYASAIGYRQSEEGERQFQKWWSGVVHLIGKDILTTHAVYWSTMLMALSVPLPRVIFAHGWILNAVGRKMSKSEGPVVTPQTLCDAIGIDATRYWLARDIVFGNDGSFSEELVVSRLNAELANNLGNLANRSSALIEKYFGGVVPAATTESTATVGLREAAEALPERVRGAIEELAPHHAIGAVVELLSRTNQYIDGMAPWKTVKTDTAAAGEALAAVVSVLNTVAFLLSPVMPTKMAELAARLGSSLEGRTFARCPQWGELEGQSMVSGGALFPRLELPLLREE